MFMDLARGPSLTGVSGYMFGGLHNRLCMHAIDPILSPLGFA